MVSKRHNTQIHARSLARTHTHTEGFRAEWNLKAAWETRLLRRANIKAHWRKRESEPTRAPSFPAFDTMWSFTMLHSLMEKKHFVWKKKKNAKWFRDFHRCQIPGPESAKPATVWLSPRVLLLNRQVNELSAGWVEPSVAVLLFVCHRGDRLMMSGKSCAIGEVSHGIELSFHRWHHATLMSTENLPKRDKIKDTSLQRSPIWLFSSPFCMRHMSANATEADHHEKNYSWRLFTALEQLGAAHLMTR